MVAIFDNMGKINIQQTRTLGNLDGGETAYIVTTTLSDPVNFTQLVADKKPQNLFLYQNDDYIRLISLDDFNEYPADHPDEEDGFYRKAVCTKTFTSESKAVAYANALYEEITKFLIIIYDYEQTLKNFVETDTVPNTTNNTLYTNIQLYLSVLDQIEALDLEIIKKEGMIEAYEKVIDLNELTSTVAEPEKAPEKLSRINTNLLDIYNKLTLVATAPTYSLKDMAAFFSDYPIPDNIISRVADIETKVNIIIANWVAVKAAAAAGGGATTEINNISQALDGNIGVPPLITSVSTSATQFKSDLATYLPSVRNANSKVEDSKDTIYFDLGLINDNVGSITKGLQIKGINQSELQSEYDTTLGDLEELKEKKDELLADKQKYAATLVQLEPDIDLSDPMTIYNHRIFKRPETS